MLEEEKSKAKVLEQENTQLLRAIDAFKWVPRATEAATRSVVMAALSTSQCPGSTFAPAVLVVGAPRRALLGAAQLGARRSLRGELPSQPHVCAARRLCLISPSLPPPSRLRPTLRPTPRLQRIELT